MPTRWIHNTESSPAYLATTINTDLFCSPKITKLNCTHVHYYTRLQSFFSLIYRAFEPMHTAFVSIVAQQQLLSPHIHPNWASSLSPCRPQLSKGGRALSGPNDYDTTHPWEKTLSWLYRLPWEPTFPNSNSSMDWVSPVHRVKNICTG